MSRCHCCLVESITRPGYNIVYIVFTVNNEFPISTVFRLSYKYYSSAVMSVCPRQEMAFFKLYISSEIDMRFSLKPSDTPHRTHTKLIRAWWSFTALSVTCKLLIQFVAGYCPNHLHSYCCKRFEWKKILNVSWMFIFHDGIVWKPV